MEPVSAIATTFLTKFAGKMGEKPAERVPAWGNLMNLLKRKSPETASSLELAAQNPNNDNIAQSCGMLEEAAKSDKEIAAAVKALVETVQSPTIENWRGTNIKHSTVTINNPKFDF